MIFKTVLFTIAGLAVAASAAPNTALPPPKGPPPRGPPPRGSSPGNIAKDIVDDLAKLLPGPPRGGYPVPVPYPAPYPVSYPSNGGRDSRRDDDELEKYCYRLNVRPRDLPRQCKAYCEQNRNRPRWC